MKTSESINELAAALVAFQSKIKPLNLDREVRVKTRTGGEYSFKYATLANCKDSTREELAKNGLSVSQVIGEGGSVTTILMHTSGQFIADSFAINPVEQNPQAIGSAISYAKRYAFTAILGLVAEDDDDANIAEGNQFTAASSDKMPPKSYANAPKYASRDDGLPWMTEKEYGSLLDEIRAGKHFEKTEEQLVAEELKKHRMKRVYKEGIKQEMQSHFNKIMIDGNTTAHTEPAGN